MSAPEERRWRRHGIVSGFVLLCIRGIMLWLVVPLGVMAWIPWRLFSSQRSGLGTFLGWIDLNLIAGIERTVLRPFVIEPLDWTPASEIRGVAHRVRLVDPW